MTILTDSLQHTLSGRRLFCAVGGAIITLSLLALPLAAQGPDIEEKPSSDETQATSVVDSVADSGAGFFTEVVDVRVINVDVFVSDRSGLSVAGLGPDDFVLEVDGEMTPISNFYAAAGRQARETLGSIERRSDPSFRTLEEVEAEAPRRSHVVILIDHTRLRATNRKRALTALREAVGRVGKESLIAVVGVEGSLVFYSDFLYDRQAIDRILEDATRRATPTEVSEFERRRIFGELARGQSGGLFARWSQADQQALLARIQVYAAEEHARGIKSLQNIERVVSTLAGVPGRKTLLYLGEGIPTRPGEGLFVEWRNRFGGGAGNDEIGLRHYDFDTDYARAIGRYELTDSMRQLAKTANRAGVTLYSIDTEGDHGGEVRSALTEQGATSETLSVVDENFREPLEYASKATGGKLLRSSGRLDKHLAEIVGDLDSYYSIGFMVPSDWESGLDYDIKVEVKGRGLLVRHREEVSLPEPDQLEASATLAALRYQTANNPLSISATPNSGEPRSDGSAVLSVRLEIPIASLEMLPQGDKQAGSVSIYVSTRGADGDASKVQKIPFHLAIPNEMMTQAVTDSARYDLPLVLQPGDQQVAIGVRDNVSGEFSAVRLDVADLAP
jgi:VWFA-related protein